MEGNLLTYISESYFEQQKTSKNSITAHTNKLFAYAMRGLGLSCAAGLLLVPLLLVSRCPTQVVFSLLGMLESFTLKSSNMNKPNNSITSPELQVFMELHQIKTVSALLEHDNVTLLEMKGFGWRLMKEVLDLREI